MSGKLIEEVKANQTRLFLQFGGQGSPYIKELMELSKNPLMKNFFDVVYSALKQSEHLINAGDAMTERGIDLKKWIEHPETLPPEDYLTRGSISMLMIFITQTANFHLFTLKGYPVDELFSVTEACTGHSQGIVAACLAALGKKGEEYYETLYKFVQYSAILGYKAQGAYPYFEVEPKIVAESESIGDKNPSPMVACIGYTKDELIQRVAETNSLFNLTKENTVNISLCNTPTSIVLSAKPSSLLLFRKKYKEEMDSKKIRFIYLRATAPFHSMVLAHSMKEFSTYQREKLNFKLSGQDLKIPVYSIFDGRKYNDSNELVDVMFSEIVIQPLYWDKALKVVLENSQVKTVVDFGPSRMVATLTDHQLTNHGISDKKVICVSHPKDWKFLQ